MEFNPDQRDTARFRHEASIMFEHYPSGRYYEAMIFTYSRGGLYFESDYAPKVGAEIFIGVENSRHIAGHDVYRAKVIWKKEVADRKSFFFYGIGVKYG